jgi:hypothetical protein
VFRNFWSSINGGDDLGKIRSQIRNFASLKKGLFTRANSVKTSLESIGIRATPLEKEDLIKLLTDYYNPTLDNLVPVKGDIGGYNVVQN